MDQQKQRETALAETKKNKEAAAAQEKEKSERRKRVQAAQRKAPPFPHRGTGRQQYLANHPATHKERQHFKKVNKS